MTATSIDVKYTEVSSTSQARNAFLDPKKTHCLCDQHWQRSKHKRVLHFWGQSVTFLKADGTKAVLKLPPSHRTRHQFEFGGELHVRMQKLVYL